MAGFDKIQTARDTKSNIEKNLNKLSESELVIATDENKLYAKILGVLRDLSVLVPSDITNDIESEIGVPSARLTKQLNEAINLLKTQMENKLEKGSFKGDAQSLSTQIEKNKNDISLKAFEKQNVQALFEKTIFSSDMIGYFIGDVGTSSINNKPSYTIGMSGIVDASRGFQMAVVGDQPTIAFRRFHPNVPNGVTSWTEAFSIANCPISKTSTGWAKFPNGLIIQWGHSGGYESISGDSIQKTFSLPIAFSGENYKIVLNEVLASNDYASFIAKVSVGRVDESRFNAYWNFRGVSASARYINGVSWLAIGY